MDTQRPEMHTADSNYTIIFWAALLLSILGFAYMASLIVSFVGGVFVLPPPAWLQTVGALTTLAEAPLLLILVAGLAASAGHDRKAVASIAISFTALFALSVSINRFSQLGVVRQSMANGATLGIEWFEAYGSKSIMLGLEYLGWGWFLGLGMIFTAGLLGVRGIDRWIRVLSIVYGILGIVASIGFLIPNVLSIVGFVAWGPILVTITVLHTIRSRILVGASGKRSAA